MKTWPSRQPRVTAVDYLGGYRLELRFDDGTVGHTDFFDLIVGRGGIFKQLEDELFFAKVALEAEAGTIHWPNGVDFCPDVLYSRVTGIPIPFAEQSSPSLADR